MDENIESEMETGAYVGVTKFTWLAGNEGMEPGNHEFLGNKAGLLPGPQKYVK